LISSHSIRTALPVLLFVHTSVWSPPSSCGASGSSFRSGAGRGRRRSPSGRWPGGCSLDALHPGGVDGVVHRMVDGVVHGRRIDHSGSPRCMSVFGTPVAHYSLRLRMTAGLLGRANTRCSAWGLARLPLAPGFPDARASIHQLPCGRLGQSKALIQLATGEQPGIGRDLCPMEFQLQTTVECQPQGPISGFTHWVPSRPRTPYI